MSLNFSDIKDLPSGFWGDLLGYGSFFGNSVFTGRTPTAEDIQRHVDAYDHLTEFDDIEDVNDYYANRELMSFDDLVSQLGSGLDGLLHGVLGDLSDFTGVDFNSLLSETGLFDKKSGNDNSAAGAGSGTLAPATIDYLNAELAKFYGMDRNTAYQEALANTAYQRSLRDMQAAGLNPAAIFGNGRGSTAGGVSYVGSAGSASGLGSGSKTQLFDSDTYGMFSSLAGLAAVAVTKNPGNFWLGQQSAQAVMKTLNVIDGKYGK